MGLVASSVCALCSGCYTLGSCCSSTNGACSKNAARLTYVALIVASVFLAVIMKNFMVDDLKDYYAFEGACDQDKCLEHSVVYRFSLLNVVFFGALAVLTPGCEMLHLQLWQVKIPLYLCGMVGVFLMDNSSFNNYEDVARVFSAIFLFLQIFLLLEFSFQIDEVLIKAANKADESRNLDPEDGCAGYCKNWIRIIYIVLLLGIWGGTIGFWVAMYTQFDCSFGHAMTSIVLVATIVMQIVGNIAGEYLNANPEEESDEYEAGQGTGMLPCAIGGLYSTYLTFSALTSNPDEDCNPFAGKNGDASLWIGVTFSAISIGYMGYSFSNGFNAAFCACCTKGGCCEEVGELCCYEDEDEPTQRKSLAESDDMHRAAAGDVEAADADRDNTRAASSSNDNRELSRAGKCGKAGFDRFIFHITLLTCGFYMAMVLTNWAKQPTSNEDYVEDTTGKNNNLDTSDESMWIKLSSMFLTLGLYFWIIVAPFIFTGRDFGSDA